MLEAYFRHRSSIVLLLACPIVLWTAREVPLAVLDFLLGTPLIAAGVTLRVLAIRRIGRGARVYRAHASAGLICSGPYAWTRNPLYLAAGAMLAGFAVLAGGGARAAVSMLVATLLVYLPVIVHEERALIGLLGAEYRRYCLRVPRILGPSFRLPEATASLPCPWTELIRREKFLIPGTLAATLGVLLGRLGFLPIAGLVDGTGALLGVNHGLAVAGGFAVAAAGNSWKIRRKQQRRHGPRPGAVTPIRTL